MMYGNYGAGWNMMGGWGATWGLLGLLTWLVWLVAGVLVCIWLWKQIQKK